MTGPIDLYVGKHLHRRRRLVGLMQQALAEQVGIRFQQIQKYECGANRVSAARLFELSEALSVPVQYFYEGLSERDAYGPDDTDTIAPDVLSKKRNYGFGARLLRHGRSTAQTSARSGQIAGRRVQTNPEAGRPLGTKQPRGKTGPYILSRPRLEAGHVRSNCRTPCLF